MTELEMVLQETQKLGCKIKDVLRMSTYDKYDDMNIEDLTVRVRGEG